MEDGHSRDDIYDQSMRDVNVYAVVHTASTYVPWSKIEKDFVVEFKLGPVDRCIYIVKMASIINPLFVFEDYGGSTGEKRFCVLPNSRWGRYFGSRINP